MTLLSVNINKFATLRNARGGNNPNLLKSAIDCERFGAQGITIHPRPDERHITKSDVYELSRVVQTDFNIEGFPSNDFIDMVLNVCPTQVTLVPDAPNALTSNAGWDCVKQQHFLIPILEKFTNHGIRTSLFIDPKIDQIKAAEQTGTNRIELYTEDYAKQFPINKEAAIAPYIEAAKIATQLQLGLNAGHDLDLNNLRYFSQNIENLLEVSIGHALICDAIYLGIHNTIIAYLNALHPDFD